MQKGYTLRGAAKASGLPISTFHWCKKRGIVNPDVADDKGNLTLYSETQVEKAKAYRATNQPKPQKKSEDEIMDSFFGGAFDASIQNPEPQKDEVIIISDAPIQNSDTGNQDNFEPLPAPAELIPPAVISANVDSNTQADKKITLATADQSTASEEKTAVLNTQQQNSTGGGFVQELANLPAEILALPRWIKVGTAANPKEPTTPGWQRAKNQRHYNKIRGKIGFVCSVHKDDRADETREDYMLIDGDHILDPATGKFVSPKAKRWIEFLLNSLANGEPVFCERSLSKSGVHILCKPTRGKFELAAGDSGTLYFGKHDTIEERKSCPKIELFVGSAGRQVVLTGDLFKCEKGAGIPSGETVDDIIETLINQIQIENKPKIESATPKETPAEKPKQPPKKFSGYGIAQETIDAVNKISADSIEAKGFISKAPKGHYICPHCGSGTHENASGALATDNNRGFTHWHCHSASCTLDGNNIQLFAEIWKLDISKDFTKIVKRLCDEFGISFEYNAPITDDSEEFIWTQDRIKSCPVNLRLPANYQFGKSNITLVVPPKKTTDEPKYICVARTPIVPTKKFREPVKGTIEYEFAILSDNEWRKVEIDGAALADVRDFAKTLSRHGALIKEPKILCNFFADIISLNSTELPKLKSHNQTGWVTDDYNDFAFPRDDKAVVRRQGYDYEKIFKPKGDREEWKKKFDEVVAQGGTYAKIIIGFAAAAPLLRPLDLPNLQLHIHGRKSIGKTPMQKFAVSIFGDTKVGALTHTFAATPKSRLETACAFCDLPLICEELETLSKREAEKIPQDVYNYFLGIGGQALNKDGTKRDPKIFSGARLTSGEHSLIQQFGNAGEFKRVLELRCADLLEEEFAADLYPFVERNRGLFAEQWIHYIIKNHEFIKTQYYKAMKEITSRQKGRGNENDRTQLSTLVISAVSYQHFKICIGLSNLATDADAINAELNADIETVIANLPTTAEMDDTARAAEDLSSYVASHDKSFAHEKDNGEEEIAWGLNCCGIKFANGEVAFHPTELRRILQDELGYVSANKLINEWHDKGKLIANSGRKEHVIQIGKKLRKTIHFKANVIETANDSAELNYYEKLGVV